MKKRKSGYPEIDSFYEEIESSNDPYSFKTTSLSEFIEADQRISIMLIKVNGKIECYRYTLLNTIYGSQINIFKEDLKSINKYSDNLLRFNSKLPGMKSTLTMRTENSMNTESLNSVVRLFNKLYV